MIVKELVNCLSIFFKIVYCLIKKINDEFLEGLFILFEKG